MEPKAFRLGCADCEAEAAERQAQATRFALNATDTPCCNAPHLCGGPDPACYPYACASREADAFLAEAYTEADGNDEHHREAERPPQLDEE